MDRIPVESSCLLSVGHAVNILEAEFPSGKVFQYLGVTPLTYDELVNAPSIGNYFNERIKDQYPFREIKTKRAA